MSTKIPVKTPYDSLRCRFFYDTLKRVEINSHETDILVMCDFVWHSMLLFSS